MKKIIIPIGVGIIGFMLVVGAPTLSFQNIVWLSKGDALFNYLGWEIFRYGPLTNPVGLNPNYGLEFSNSIVYSDSIPLLAIFFKLFSNSLGEPFQYFGLWLLACFIFQAVFGYKLAELITNNKWLQLFISIIFLFTPVMLFKTNLHLALAGHFLILWAIYLNFKKNVSGWWWAVLIFLVLGVHFYLFVMVITLWTGSLLDRWTSTGYLISKKLVVEAIVIFLVVIISAWQYGYFAISLESSAASGYGREGINLIAFFNPLSWSLLIKNNIFLPTTIEGFGYAGAGVIAAFIISIFVFARQEERHKLFQKAHKHKFMLTVLIILFLVSLTNNMDIGNSHYKLPINEHLAGLLNVVRSSGRLSWPLLYLLTFIAFYLIINGYRRGLVPLFAMLCSLQIVDTSKGWRNLHDHFSSLRGSNIAHSLTNEFWSQAPNLYSTIRIITPYWNSWNNIGVYAAKNRMATNSVYLARVDRTKLERAIKASNQDIASGDLDPKTIYLFQKWNSDINLVTPKFDSRRDLFARIDGVTLLAPNYKLCGQCKSVDPAFEITSMVPKLKIGEEVKFSDNGKGGEFLIDGWTHLESWGVWSSGTVSTVAIPLGDSSPSRIQFTFRGMVGSKHQISNVKVFLNGEYQKTIQITKHLNNSMLISIPEEFRHNNFVVLKFEYLNPTSPKNAGYGNQDDRILTLGIQSVQILR